MRRRQAETGGYEAESLEPRRMLDAAANAAVEQLSLSPAVFVQNVGQWTDPAVRFVQQGKGASIAMTDAGPVFELYRDVTPAGPTTEPDLDLGRRDRVIDDRQIERTRFSVSFVDANSTSPVGRNLSESKFNYFLGDPSQHRSNVAGFETVVYPNLYNGIDLHAWGQRDSLKYEFHVAPGSDYAQIALRYNGIDHLWIDRQGRLNAELTNGFGRVTDDAPVIYQDVNGRRTDVSGRFKLMDDQSYTFELTGPFDPALPLIVDPELAWSSYLGGIGSDSSDSVAIDVSGNAWVTGTTTSPGWAVGGFDPNFNGGTYDAFIAKINADGTLGWSSYLGGSSDDYGGGIAIDGAGSAWVTGTTQSSGWVSGGFNTNYNGGLYDGFVGKISAAGVLVWSSYLGAAGTETGYDLSIDGAGNAWVTGFTNQTGKSFTGDVLIAKINTVGTLAWMRAIGGDGLDQGYQIATDSAGNGYVTGYTASAGWASGGFDTSYAGGADGFIAKLGASGTLLWSSYLGSTDYDEGDGIAIDSSGDAWVVGITRSAGWIVGGFDVSHNGDFDAFIAKVTGTGSLVWSSYLGGSGVDFGYDVTLDGLGKAWVTGFTRAGGWAGGGFDTVHNGGDDAFIAKINPDRTLAWSSYLGGASDDSGGGIATDGAGNAWVTGATASPDWAVGGFDLSYNGGMNDAFVAKIREPSLLVPVLNSRAGAFAKLFLDFDGDVTPDWGEYHPNTTPPYTIDAEITTFSTQELQNINDVWARVAEKFSPFNINVTTVDPGNLNNGETFRIVIGGDGNWTHETSFGGIAFIDSFTSPDPNTGWVFSWQNPTRLQFVADASAHEAGHGFGLDHQSVVNGNVVLTEYNPGDGVKAPIMGDSYSATRGLWWLGASSYREDNSVVYAGIQDDLDKLQRPANGFGYRIDDVGNNTGNATTLASSNPVQASGVITRTSDVDYFRYVTIIGGRLDADVRTTRFGNTPIGMLDAVLELRNSADQLLPATHASGFDESLSYAVSPGTYYLVVRSQGSYGDIGQYTLTVSIAAVPPPAPTPPDLEPGSDSGPTNSDNITNDTTPTFTGTGQSGAIVHIFSDGVEVGSGPIIAGSWSITASPLTSGVHSITAIANNSIGPSPVSAALAVQIDTTAPAVSQSQFKFQENHRLIFSFTEDIGNSLTTDDLTLQEITSGAIVSSTALDVVYASGSATFSFPGFADGLLSQGNYRATLSSNGITDVAGNSLSGNPQVEFFVLPGDANRDRIVNIADFAIMAGNFNRSGFVFSQGDFNYSGTVEIGDFSILASRFNTNLPAPSAIPSPSASGESVANTARTLPVANNTPRRIAADRAVFGSVLLDESSMGGPPISLIL